MKIITIIIFTPFKYCSIISWMFITLKCNWNINKMSEVLGVVFEDFLIGGGGFVRESYEYRHGQKDAFTDLCNPNYMFWSSTMKDPRHWDISMIGEIHDITFNELCSKFASNKEEYAQLHTLYADQAAIGAFPRIQDADKKHDIDDINFYTPADPTLCRVFEVWTQEMKPRYRCHDWLNATLYKIDSKDINNINIENQMRMEQGLSQGMEAEDIPLIDTTFIMDNYWYYRFMTPQGYVLAEGETPYWHESHPYTIKLYPFINGEIHSFVNDVIDQQRYINRMITLQDFVIRTGAKGVTMVPVDAVPDEMTPEEFAEQWTKVDGLIFYKPKPNVAAPQTVYNKAVNVGTYDMLQLQLQMMEDVSSVHRAAQGKQPYSGTSAALYAQQSANSTASLARLLQSFSSFIEDIATKKVKVIQQYYDEPRIINIAGKSYGGVKKYEPDQVRDILFDITIKESASTPEYRMLMNDMLLQFWQSGAITVEMLLENGDFPFSDQLLQSIAAQKEQAQEQAGMLQGGNIDPAILSQIQQGADAQQVAAANQMMQI